MLAKKLAKQLAGVRGVDPGTPRVSLAPPAASFAFDPARGSATEIVRAINKSLAPGGLSLTIVRVGAPGGPSASAKGADAALSARTP